MRNDELNFTVEEIVEGISQNNITFDHPLQRKANQWSLEQCSSLMHSAMAKFAIPEVYAMPIEEGDDESCFSVLDGKQRFTAFYNYMHDGFKLTADTFTVPYKRANEMIEYEVAGKYYSELEPCLQNKLRKRKLKVTILHDYTDDDIAEQFRRLNNGVSLTKDQKTRVDLGDDLCAFIDEVEESEFFNEKSNKSYFTALQRIHGEVQTCILQTLMLIMDYPYKNFTNDVIMDFAKWFKVNHKNSDLEYCVDIFGKLNEAIPTADAPNKLMRKINIPILAYHVQTVDEIGLPIEKYGEWIQSFFDAYTPDCEYASYCGQGSTSKSKVRARLNYVDKEIRKLVN